MSWIAIQLGSREHYFIPVALHSANQLEVLITDAWISSKQSMLAKRIPFLPLRRNPYLPDTLVKRRTLARLLTDARLKFKRLDPWRAILFRNYWFQCWAEREVSTAASQTIFSYSYTARLPFRAARRRGGLCILGQIDPGPREHDIIDLHSARYRSLTRSANYVPDEYWSQWREEISLAHKIVVNSPWSAQLLQEAGVPAHKLVEIPLVYSPGLMNDNLFLTYPSKTQHRRLRALFLGSVILRKGIGQLFDAIQMLADQPVDFTFAGPIGVLIPGEISSLPNVRFLGPVNKNTAESLYREADVFLFPTLSDGFGLTQLEALGHGLPVIASQNCARVIEDRVNGLVLPDVTPETIAEAILELVRDRSLLAMLQANASVPDRFHPRHLAPALLALESQ